MADGPAGHRATGAPAPAAAAAAAPPPPPPAAGCGKSSVRVGVCVLLVAAVTVITATSFAGFVAADLQTRQSILATATDMTVLQVSRNLDDAAVMLQMVGWAWRRLDQVRGHMYIHPCLTGPAYQPLLSQPVDALFVDALPTFLNSTLINSLSYFYVGDVAGNLHGVQLLPDGSRQIMLYNAASRNVSKYSYDTATHRRASVPVSQQRQPSYDAPLRLWYTNALTENGACVWTPPYVDAFDGSTLITVSRAIYAFDLSLLGVVALDIRLSSAQQVLLASITSAEAYFQGSYTLLLSPLGLLGSSNGRDWQMMQPAYGPQNAGTTLSADGLLPLTATGLSDGTAAVATLFNPDTASSCGTLDQLADACDTTVWHPADGSFTLMVSMKRATLSAFADDSSWYVITVAPAPNPLAQQSTRLSLTLALVLIVSCGTLIATGCCTGMLATVGARRKWRQGYSSPRQGMELQDWRVGSKRPSAANPAFRATSDSRRMRTHNLSAPSTTTPAPSVPGTPAAKAPKRTLSLNPVFIATVSTIVLGTAFGIWSLGMGEFSELVVTKSSVMQEYVQMYIHAITARPAQAAAQIQQAIAQGDIPLDPQFVYAHRNVTLKMERFFVDTIACYRASLLPIQGAITGYPNGDSYGASLDAGFPGGIKLRYRDTSTTGRLFYPSIGSNGYRNSSKQWAAPTAYDTLARPWYKVAAALPNGGAAFSPVYAFAAPPGQRVPYGATFSVHVQDAARRYSMNFGIDLTLDLIINQFRVVSPSVDDGLLFLAEAAPGLPLLATTIADITGCVNGGSVRLNATTIGGVPSPFTQVALQTNDSVVQLGRDMPVRSMASIGLGLSQLTAQILLLQGPGLKWVLVLGYYNVAFLRDLFPFDNAVMVVTLTCLWLVLAATVRLTGGMAHRAQLAADTPVDDDAELQRLNRTVSDVSEALANLMDTGKPVQDTSFLEQLQGTQVSMAHAAAVYDTFEQFMDGIVAADSMLVTNPMLARKHGSSFSRAGAGAARGATGTAWVPATDVIWRAMCMITHRPQCINANSADPVIHNVIADFVALSLRGTNPVKLVAFVVGANFSNRRLRLLHLAGHSLYQAARISIACLYMLLTIWQVDDATATEARPWTVPVEALLALFLLADVVVQVELVRMAAKLSRQPARRFSPAHVLIGRGKIRVRQLALHAALIAFICIDVLVRFAWQYDTGSGATHLSLPLSALLRPLLILVYAQSVRRAMSHFLGAIAKSQAVFSVLLAMMLVFAFMTLAILAKSIEPSDLLGQGFSDIRASILTMFVFLCTQSNYLDVVNFAMEQSEWLLVYFVFITFAGFLLLISLLVASFQTSYTESYEADHTAETALAVARCRIGLFLAFRCLRLHALTADQSNLASLTQPGAVQLSGLAQLLSGLSNPLRTTKASVTGFFADRSIALPSASSELRAATRKFDSFKKDFQDTFIGLDLMTNVGGCDDLFIGKLEALVQRCKEAHKTARKVSARSFADIAEFIHICETHAYALMHPSLARAGLSLHMGAWQVAARRFFDDAAFVSYYAVLNIALKLHVMLLALSWTFLEQYALIPLYCLVAIHCVELLVKAYAEGLPHFWRWPRLAAFAAQGKPYLDVAMKWDVVVSSSAAVLLLVAAGTGDITVLRLGISLPVIRLLTCANARRIMVFGLMDRLPQFVPLVSLQGILMYLYAVIGCWWFAGQFSTDDPKLEFSNFDTFTNAAACLFQLLSGDSWEEVMYLAFESRGSLLPVFYFLSYVILFVLMFTNVVIAIVVEAYQMVDRARKAPTSSISASWLDALYREAQKEKLLRFVKLRVIPRYRNRRRGGV